MLPLRTILIIAVASTFPLTGGFASSATLTPSPMGAVDSSSSSPEARLQEAVRQIYRLLRADNCDGAGAMVEKIREDTRGSKNPEPKLWVRVLEARVLLCKRECVKAHQVIESYLKDSKGVGNEGDADAEWRERGRSVSREVDACLTRQKKKKWALIGSIVGSVIGGVALTVPLVLRFPLARTPSAGAAMSSSALHLTVRF